MKTTFFLCIAFCAVAFFSCKKESFITSPDANIIITTDTLHFDTVFTSTGSVTQSFKIINDNDQKLRINKIQLKGGASSSYQINADGFKGPEVSNLEINANDSLYIFVSVAINPGNDILPFIIRDSIEITYNNNLKKVQLEAWGQNAHFFRHREITNTETWTNDLPYVILGSLYIRPGATLNIEKGCRIYIHADAPIIIDGTLKVNGLKDSADRVYFQGDRLDEPYKNFPAGWPGLFFRAGSKDNILNYAILNNAYQTIAVAEPSVNANPKITLNQCIISNAYDAGILAVNSDIKATNCLVSNCGKNIFFLQGGNYNLTNCTVASYSNFFIQHKEPALFISNSISVNNVPVINNLDAVFRNCIFWGEGGLVDNEVVVAKEGSSTFNVTFDHVLMKVQADPSNSTLTGIIKQEPQFDSINTAQNFYNFHLKPGSPAIDKGVENTGVAVDLDGKMRPAILPDLGAYEKQ